MDLTEPKIVTLDIDNIRPYWRNPRRISNTAIDKVKESLERYGYQAPIIVDPDGVIITGHTRYSALRQLGVDQVPVIVSDMDPEKAHEYRVLDNRTSEYATWDNDLLAVELQTWENDLISDFFPSLTLHSETAQSIPPVTTQDFEKAATKVEQVGTAPQHERPTVDVTCPHCFQTFTIEPPGV